MYSEQAKEKLAKLLKAGILAAVVFVLFSPLVLGPFGLSFSEYPKTIYFRTLIEIALILWLILLAVDFSYAPRINLLSGAVIAFFAAQIISSLAGFNFERSLWGTLEAGRGLITDLHYLAFFLLLAGVFRTKEKWVFLLRVFIFVSFFSTLAGFMQKAGLQDFYGAGLVDSGRISGTLSNPVYLGSFLVVAIFLGLYLVLTEFQRDSRIVFAIITAFNFLALLFTGTRGAFAGLIFGLLIFGALFLFLFAWPDKKRRRIIFSVILGGGLLLLLLMAVHLKIGIPDGGLFSRINSISNAESINGRLPAWDVAVKAWKDKPLFGWGTESFGYLYDRYFDAEYYKIRPSYDVFNDAHNKVLNLAAENGALAVSFYLSIFAIVLAALWRRRKDIGVLASFILIGLFSGYFFQNLFAFDTVSTSMAFFLLLGFVSACVYGEKISEKSISQTGILSRAIVGIFVVAIFLALYYANLKPALASYDFVLGVSAERNSFPLADAYYEKGINRNTPYSRELIMFRASRDVAALENSQARQNKKEAALDLMGMRGLLADNSTDSDVRYLNLLDLRARANEWAYLVGGEKAALTEAKNISEKALEFNDQWPQFYYFLGRIAIYQGNAEEGEAFFWKGYDLSPKGLFDLAEVYKIIGVAYFRAGNNGAAARNFQKAVNIKYSALKSGVGSYPLTFSPDLSEKEQIRLAAASSSDASFFEGTALLFFQLGDTDTALEIYQKALEILPMHETRLRAGLDRLRLMLMESNKDQ